MATFGLSKAATGWPWLGRFQAVKLPQHTRAQQDAACKGRRADSLAEAITWFNDAG